MAAQMTMPAQSFNPYQQQQQQQQGSAQMSGPPPPPQPSPPQQQQQIPSQQQYPQEIPYQKPSSMNIPPLLDNSHIDSPIESPIGAYYETGDANVTSENAHLHQAFVAPESSLASTIRGINLRYQLFLDKVSPHWKARWTFSLIALTVFLARVVLAQGWYVICYALAIYYLNLLIGFISPKIDPSVYSGDENDDCDDTGPMLPTRATDEFKPFIRRVPEFKFWISGTKATLIALFLSLFPIFDVPVFWPILLIYFIILFACTMRQQIRHMIRYSYVPWDSGKKRYTAPRENPVNLYPTTV